MNDSYAKSITQMEEFLKASTYISLKAQNKQEIYDWISRQINTIKYFKLKRRKDKSTVIKYLVKMTGYQKSNIKKLVGKKRVRGELKLKLSSDWGKRNNFPKVYTEEDIELMAKTDNLHRRPSGQSLKATFKRMFTKFGVATFIRLQHISVSHIYNLRDTVKYEKHSKTFAKTNPVSTSIGIRKKPNPRGKPGYLRVDSVHQGDMGEEKGVYHINLVDEVLQWQLSVAVEGISERFLLPLLEEALSQFPYRIVNFHSDNGSEYINYRVAELLEKMLIDQTKSRSRHTNDNALVECKNKITRKWMGHIHIPRRFAPKINSWYKTYFNVYLNFHRPCAYPTVYTDKRGKQRKQYKTYLTPYEKLKSIPDWEKYLNKGVIKADLDKTANDKSDNDFAEIMVEERLKLFKSFKSKP